MLACLLACLLACVLLESNCYLLQVQVRPDKPFRLAIGSFIEDANNRVEVIYLDQKGDPSPCLKSIPSLCFSHPYPPTKLAFIPDRAATRPDLLATSADVLRLWKLRDEDVTLEKLLSVTRPNEAAAPITSFDWNDIEIRRLVTASLDTTCTVWDIERGAVETQLIAHDKEVYDVAWGGAEVFASVSADASVRVFDLRDRDHSTIIYESPTNLPLLRLAWNKQDSKYLATLTLDSKDVSILDIRYPTIPLAELRGHQAPVNAISWAPHSAQHICSAGEDAQALIWDLTSLAPGPPGSGPVVSLDPILAYHAGSEINHLQWSSSHPEWVAACFGNRTQILRV